MAVIPVSLLTEERGWPEYPDRAKTLVMTELVRLVEQGGAAMTDLGSGVVELRLSTGEIFHLGERTVTRVA
jgi:hypothetical protein